jgi:hypothetical protein
VAGDVLSLVESARTGPVTDALNRAARRIAEGEKANAVKSEAYERSATTSADWHEAFREIRALMEEGVIPQGGFSLKDPPTIGGADAPETAPSEPPKSSVP